MPMFYSTVVICDSDGCPWNRDGKCGRGQLDMLEYKFRNRWGGESMAVVCAYRRENRG